MFKEDWEKSHLNVEISREDVLEMIKVAGIGEDLEAFEILDGGCANVNILAVVDGAPYIFRVYIRDPKTAFKEEKLYKLLKEKVPVPKVYGVFEARGYTYGVMEFKEGRTLRDILLGEIEPSLVYGVMKEVGVTLAKLREITFKKGGFFNKDLEVKEFTSEDGYIDFARKILCSNTAKELFSSQEIEQIEVCLEKNKKHFPADVESNLVHGDFNPANILIGKDFKVSAVLDLEYAFSGSTLSDIADMLREAHLIDPCYRDGFLKGLVKGKFWIPEKLDQSVCVINIVTLLDCIVASPEKPNLVADSKRLIFHMVEELSRVKKIEVLPYDPLWKEQFEKESKKIADLLGESCVEVHHFGSTSIPGLAAKRDLDVILVVDRLEHSLKLQELGYVFKGEINIPLRYFFSKNMGESKVNLHVCEKGHGFIALNLRVRDFLREHDEVKDLYGELKFEVAKEEGSGEKVRGRLSRYALTKDPFIKEVLAQAGYDGYMVNFCFHEKEWKAAKQFSKDSELIEGEENHKHFVLYKGTDIIGYAHLELLEGDIQIKEFEVKGDKEGKKYFKDLIQKWERVHYG